MSIKRKLSSIISGWKNVIIEDKEFMPLYQSRFDICQSCEYNKLQVCGICGCPLVSKTKSLLEECPYPEGSKWLPTPRYDENGVYRLRSELPENLQHYFENEVIEEKEWQEFTEKHK